MEEEKGTNFKGETDCYWLVYLYHQLDERIFYYNVDDYEKLKIKVAEQLEEKEEQYLKEKQINIG